MHQSNTQGPGSTVCWQGAPEQDNEARTTTQNARILCRRHEHDGTQTIGAVDHGARRGGQERHGKSDSDAIASY